MCYASSCQPLCGKCKPPRLKAAHCPECGQENYIGREEFLILTELPHRENLIEKKLMERGGVEWPVCTGCGTDLEDAFRAAVVPLACTRSAITCGWPCGLHVEPRQKTGNPCPNMVPLGKA